MSVAMETNHQPFVFFGGTTDVPFKVLLLSYVQLTKNSEEVVPASSGMQAFSAGTVRHSTEAKAEDKA